MPVQSNVPTSFSVPDTLPTSSYDYNSYLPNDYDWTRANTHSGMDMDSEERRRIKSGSAPIPITRKLQFTDVDTPALAGLGGLDVSFDASPSEDGRIRVRIHPSSSVGQAGSPSNSDLSSRPNTGQPDIWSGTAKSNTFASPYSISSSKDDPFFGIGMPNDYGMLSPIVSSMTSHQYHQLSSPIEYGQLPDSSLAYGSQFTLPGSPTSATRRVRIALKSLPVTGGEGGEWEVQIC
jgi:hypothetical protein